MGVKYVHKGLRYWFVTVVIGLVSVGNYIRVNEKLAMRRYRVTKGLFRDAN